MTDATRQSPRFYKVAAAEPAAAGGHRVTLDGKPMRTPAKGSLVVPTRALAEAIADEWARQGERIDPATMPLTRLANSAIDGVRGREAETAKDIVAYAASDLLCYRAEGPDGLLARQREAWDPVLAWAETALDARFKLAQGVMPVAQEPEIAAAVARMLDGRSAFALAALHVLTSLTGSALLALAHADGRLDVETAWAAAHVDEDWQIGQWGEDAEAAARRERRQGEFAAAARFLALLR